MAFAFAIAYKHAILTLIQQTGRLNNATVVVVGKYTLLKAARPGDEQRVLTPAFDFKAQRGECFSDVNCLASRAIDVATS